jgi:hypothetical protein
LKGVAGRAAFLNDRGDVLWSRSSCPHSLRSAGAPSFGPEHIAPEPIIAQ